MVMDPQVTSKVKAEERFIIQKYDSKYKRNRIIIIGRGKAGFIVSIIKLLYYSVKTIINSIYKTIKLTLKFLIKLMSKFVDYLKSIFKYSCHTYKKFVHLILPESIHTIQLQNILDMVCFYFDKLEHTGNIYISLIPNNTPHTYLMYTTIYLHDRNEKNTILEYLKANIPKYKKSITKSHLDLPFKIKSHYIHICDTNISTLIDYLKISNKSIPLIDKYFLKKTEILFNGEINDIQGSIPIGYQLIEGIIPFPNFFISLKDLTSHMSVLGMNAFGKSRFIYNYLYMLNLKGIKFLVLDTKGEYMSAIGDRILFKYYELAHSEFNIRLDIFKVPEGVKKADHISFLETVFLQLVGDTITPQQHNLLHLAIQNIIYNDGTFKEFVFNLKNQITKTSKLNVKKQYLYKLLIPNAANLEQSVQGLLNKILPLMTGPTGNCFNVNSSNIDFEFITTSNVIINLSIFERNYNESARKFFINTFYYYFINFLSNKQGNIRERGNISNVMIIEEAQRIVRSTYIGKTEIRSLLGSSPQIARAAGLSLAFIANDIDLESPILTNTAVNILFFNKYDPYVVSRLLHISIEEYRQYSNLLNEQQYFVASVNGKVTICKSFDYNLSKTSVNV